MVLNPGNLDHTGFPDLSADQNPVTEGSPEGGAADQAQGAPATQETDPSQGPSFYDGEIPPESEPIYKRFQAAYTKKTQELASQKKEFAGEVYKAQLFDQMMQNPEVVSFLNQLTSGEPTRGTGAQGRSGQRQQDANYFDEEEGQLPTGLTQELGNLRNEVKSLKLEAELRKFGQAYPNWEQEKEGMLEAWKENPYLSMKDAYLRSVGNKALMAQATRGRQDQERTRREQASTEVPNAVPTRPAVKPVNSWDDALKQALEIHKISPKDFFGGS